MAPPAEGLRAETGVATAALEMAQPAAATDHGPQHVDDVVVDVAMCFRAAVVEMAPRVGSPCSGERPGKKEIVSEDGGRSAISPVPSRGAVPEVALAVDPLVDLIEKERQRVNGTPEVRGEEELPSIWRVHPSIREQESEAYEPKLVAIGPLHRDKVSLLPMEEIKLRYLNELLSRSAENNKLSNYIRVIRDCEARARKQYAEKVEPNVDEFVKMLVLDGCFIIEHFVKMFLEEAPESGLCLRWASSNLRRDLMLLENQIPFFVLVKLFDQSTIPCTGTPALTLMEIALKFLEIDQQLPERQPQVDEVRHLLHLHHMCLDPSRIPNELPPWSCRQLLLYPSKIATGLISVLFFGLLYVVLVRKLPRCCCFPAGETGVPKTIPCAKELHQSGVKFRKKDDVNSYLVVSFREGILEIPPLPVQDSTSSKLRNLIALEQCSPQVGNHFTSYGVFMDNIINTEDDVAILRRRGIIESKLGSDGEVAKMINALCKVTHLDYKQHYNASLFKDVKQYCEVPHHKWRASLKSTHFSSPWATISLVVGIIIFGLAITQAYINISRRRRK